MDSVFGPSSIASAQVPANLMSSQTWILKIKISDSGFRVDYGGLLVRFSVLIMGVC